MLKHITLERLQEIEAERAQTETSPEFRAWMQHFNVGILCKRNEKTDNARKMMEELYCSQLNNSVWA